MKRQYRLWAIGIVALLLVAAVALTDRNPTKAKQTLALEAPAFVRASVDESTISNIGADLSSEAGISAYFRAPSPIVLNTVRNLYRTIETETPQYIVGSIPVPNYPESEDVHVYIHTDGWVLAYYLAADPTGKIFDWRSYTGSTIIPTKLENVLAIVTAQIGAPVPTITFYHFQYPNANNLMLIAEANGENDYYEVNLAGSFGYFERSWSFAVNGVFVNDWAKYYLDGTQLAQLDGSWRTSQGLLTAAQLLPGTSHTFTLNNASPNFHSYGGLSLVYRVP